METPDQPSNPKSKRRWFQYSLRTLMIVVTMFAVACSWFAVKLQQVKRQREAVEAIEKLGGRVAYDYQLNAYGNIIPGEPPGPAWLRKILGDDLFCTVVFVKPTNDASMLILKDLSGIRRLELQRSQVTDAGLECLKSLTKLQMLDLRGTKVTDAGLEHLMGLIQLRELFLTGTKLTDAGLEHLKGLNQLQTLDLLHTQATDAGLEHLKRLTNLQSLNLTRTKVTNEGVKNLQNSLPNCKIKY